MSLLDTLTGKIETLVEAKGPGFLLPDIGMITEAFSAKIFAAGDKLVDVLTTTPCDEIECPEQPEPLTCEEWFAKLEAEREEGSVGEGERVEFFVGDTPPAFSEGRSFAQLAARAPARDQSYDPDVRPVSKPQVFIPNG